MLVAMCARPLRLFRVAALLLPMLCATQVLAQPPGSVPPPPVRSSLDENGVDVTRGEFTVSQRPVSIGPAYPHGLSYTMQNFNQGWQGSVRSAIFQSGSTYTATVEGVSDAFTLAGGVYTPTEANGSSLTKSGTTFTYTGRNGVVATFSQNTGGSPFWDAPLARATSITYPDGTRVSYTYKIIAFCPGGEEGGTCPSGTHLAMRLQSVNNSHGYQLKLSYATNTLNDGSPATSYDEWSRVTLARAINNAVEYCDPSADICSLSGSWPNATMALSGSDLTVTDSAGLATRYTSNGSYEITGIRRPGAGSDTTTIAYTAGRVSSITINGVTHTYSYSTSGSELTTDVTDPNGGVRRYVADTTLFRVLSFRDELNRTTAFDYDANGRVEEIIFPEGNKTTHVYDARGNVIQTQSIPKSGSGDTTITTSAYFPTSCTYVLTCNQPEYTTELHPVSWTPR